ncbi:MarR family winged helix-turn-helix transcriptional regulator [Sunxiuqinia elliptica]|uniref:DNA-binding transcriptional regulator, MarR family n=1 Tax=Sunxiuqinia elliptica TaxID=655355 RepID=A0A1I2B5Y7_9BACT|nr:helix-turn-helix domain-containing protein [Sunxiuqinia elliptica]SFE50743.1 DNA-binding transcriptional regulator, MarR family [Sunxiuqinia elliptica]
MSVFNLNEQNTSLDKKIVAGLERLSQVFKTLLWEKAKAFGLSPIQIQLLIFIKHHSQDKSTVSYLAREFNLSKPTISDAVKTLLKKQLIVKQAASDSRSYSIGLTAAGHKLVAQTEDFASPITDLVAQGTMQDKQVLWENIAKLIVQLNKLDIISVQRTCFNCKYYGKKEEAHFCKLLDQKLETQDLRLDCAEFEQS